jgi:hypothetical protein
MNPITHDWEMEPFFGPLPDAPTPEMVAAYDVLRSDDRYPLPTTQAALWAILACYAFDPAVWSAQLVDLSAALIEGEPEATQG